MNNILKETGVFLKDRFSLSRDQEREDLIIAEIRRGVEFRGINIWILVFAIMIASIGLNMNAAAVIIGAMLISPLMGPIMGIGLAVGISDIQLIKKAAKNLGIMVAISVITSGLYFFISPLSDAQSELLSRTTPTIWDVFIGLFGGTAGIIATASKEKGNVIPGVAIATALMPPLCTAGYGLAIGSLQYFAGAFYLFSINAVFICFSTLIIVRFLRFREVNFVSPEVKNKVRAIIMVFVIAFILPSIYIARNLVVKTIYQQRVAHFINTAFNFPTTDVLRYNYIFEGENKGLEVSLMGDPLDENMIANLQNQLPGYDLPDVKLKIRQGSKGLGAEEIKSQVLETFLTRNLDSLKSKDAQISYLTKELLEVRRQFLPMQQISREAALIDSNLKELSIEPAIYYSPEGKPVDTIHIAMTRYGSAPEKESIQRLERWLKERISADSVRVIAE